MVAERITVGVYALDQVILPKLAAAKGWSARLAEAQPVLVAGAEPVAISLSEGPEGLALAADARVSGARHRVPALPEIPGSSLLLCNFRSEVPINSFPFINISKKSFLRQFKKMMVLMMVFYDSLNEKPA